MKKILTNGPQYFACDSDVKNLKSFRSKKRRTEFLAKNPEYFVVSGNQFTYGQKKEAKHHV